MHRPVHKPFKQRASNTPRTAACVRPPIHPPSTAPAHLAARSTKADQGPQVLQAAQAGLKCGLTHAVVHRCDTLAVCKGRRRSGRREGRKWERARGLQEGS